MLSHLINAIIKHSIYKILGIVKYTSTLLFRAFYITILVCFTYIDMRLSISDERAGYVSGNMGDGSVSSSGIQRQQHWAED